MSTSKAKTHEIGQRVFIPRYGIARISAIETENVSGMEIEMFRLTFDSPNDIFSAQANINTIKKVPVFKSDKSFFRLPSRKQLTEAVALATSDAQTTSGRWKHQQVKLEDGLKSGDLMMVAHVFRKTKEGMDGVEASYSKRILYDEALKTLCAVYAEVFQLDHVQAMEIFVPTKIEPGMEISEEATEMEMISSSPLPLLTERKKSEKPASLGPGWDMPIVSALRISNYFSEKTQAQIIEKLPCKTLSELFNLTQGDWPLHAPSTTGISTDDARIIQYDTQELVKRLSRSVA